MRVVLGICSTPLPTTSAFSALCTTSELFLLLSHPHADTRKPLSQFEQLSNSYCNGALICGRIFTDSPNACMIPYTPYTPSTPYIPYTPCIPCTHLNNSLYVCYVGIHDRLQWSKGVYSSKQQCLVCFLCFVHNLRAISTALPPSTTYYCSPTFYCLLLLSQRTAV